MPKNKMNIIFHNPNTSEETIKYISTILAEVAVSKVIKAQQKCLESEDKPVHMCVSI